MKALLLVVAIFIAYQPVWRAGFIWDDDDHLTSNPCVVGPLGFKQIWTTAAARICPLVISSFRVQHAIWGLDPLPYHLFTILMHACGAIVLWRVLARLAVPGAWFGAALWALHPVQVESVAWITELKNTQSGFFYMLTALFFVRARLAEQAQETKRARRNDWVALGFGVLALASKSSTVILPLVLGLCAWWVERGWRWRNAAKLAPYVALAAMSSALSIWTQAGEGLTGPEWARTWPERIAVTGKVVWFYLGKLLWPHPLIFIYPKWEIHARQVTAYLPLALVLLTLVILWLGRERWSEGLFMAFAYFLAALLPVLGILDHYFLCYSFVGDHFQYLASVGPLALVGAVLWRAFGVSRSRSRFIRPAACGLLLGGLGLLSWQHAGAFRDNESLWRDTLAKHPSCWMAHNNWGYELAEQGKVDEAKAHYLAALDVYPSFPEAHFNLGDLSGAEGRTEEALAQYRAAVEAKPDFAEAHNNLSNLLAKRGDGQQALKYATEAIRLRPNYPQAHFNCGNALSLLGKVAEAAAEYSTALRLKPDYAEAHYNLGGTLFLLGKTDEAAAHLSEAARLQPANAAAHTKLGLILARQGQTGEALMHYQEALRLQPGSLEALKNQAWIRAAHPDAQYRNGAEAVRLAQQAAQLTQEKDAAVLDILAAAYAEAGDFAHAVATSERALALATATNQSSLREQILARQALYRSDQPCRQ